MQIDNMTFEETQLDATDTGLEEARRILSSRQQEYLENYQY